ncbi:MAG: hypothetical protein WC869_13145 [Phycisphaerae bacterium]|jgi:hypothetical protein
MEHQPGRKADSRARGPWLIFALGRGLGFLTLAGLAMVILAALILLPAYAQLQQVVYDRDCQQVAVNENDKTLEAQRRLIEELPDSEVLTKRLAISQGELTPDREVIVPRAGMPTLPPDVIQPVRYPRPAKPDNLLLTLGTRIEKPSTRRGLLFLAAGALLVAMFLFSPPERRKE